CGGYSSPPPAEYDPGVLAGVPPKYDSALTLPAAGHSARVTPTAGHYPVPPWHHPAAWLPGHRLRARLRHGSLPPAVPAGLPWSPDQPRHRVHPPQWPYSGAVVAASAAPG